MKKNTGKLPPVEMLRQLVDGGMTRQQIATRYHCNQDTVRNKLKHGGIVDITIQRKLNAVTPAESTVTAEHARIEETDQKVVLTRRVNLAYGGTIKVDISVPRITMYVRALDDAQQQSPRL